MRKTIMMLINGFGVEKSDSVEVYNPKYMPNIDVLSKTSLFTTLQTTAGDYNNAYRLFSMPTKSKKEEDEIDNLIFDRKLGDVQGINDVINSIEPNKKLHIFYFLEDDSKFNQVKEIIRTINANRNKKIYIHMVLTSTSTSGYKSLSKIIDKISFEMTDYLKIGTIVGRNKIDSDDMLRAFYRELGEHWNEPEKKLAILEKEIINPEDAGVFIISPGFALEENDTILFINYDNIEMERFYNDFTKIPTKQYSLYKFKDKVINIFNKNENDSTGFASICEKHNIKLLVLTNEARINDLNFYLNGMKKILSPNIKYAVNDIDFFLTKDAFITFMNTADYDGVIIDYDIGAYNKLEDIKNTLITIDKAVSVISEVSKEKDYTFILSSLYGMHAPVMDGVVQKVVNFAGKVPCMYQSNIFNKSDYSISGSNTYALGLTFLTNINDEVKENKLIHKLSGLEKMLSGKK